MASQPKASIEYVTKCRIKGCSKEFTAEPLDLTPIIGRQNERLVRFVSALMGHISKQHPLEGAAISAAVQEYMGWLIVTAFSIQDPQLVNMHDGVRAAIHRVSRKNYIADADIDDRIARLGVSPEQEDGLRILLRDMRNVLCEEGPYGPPAQPSPIIKPA